MIFFGRRRLLAAALALPLSIAVPVLATAPSLRALIDSVLRNGPDSELPAHLSVVLGLAVTEQRIPVKQAMMRDGATVRTFNVSTANDEDVVILHYNEQTRAMQAFLVSSSGALRKAVSYQAGARAAERSLVEARADFAREVKFWMDLSHQPARSHQPAPPK